ncbi:MAG: glycosyltransferase family 39 protein [Anaerolineae bacterium]|nr:glycosyltransferase family 39 protein [Anaerolineae bacterium]
MNTLKRHWALVVILSIGALLRFWRLGDVALSPDESYYWLWSNRLAPAYYDNPAGTAFVVRTSTLLGGQSEAGIRWFNALLGLGAVLLVYMLGIRCCSQPAALIASALVAVGAPYLITSRFVYTDALQLFLLLLNLYLLLPFWDNDTPSAISTWRFWAVGLSMALLFNTKYNAYLYAGTVLALMFCKRRDLFRDRRAWWAMVLALVGALPVLIWNATHAWVSFRWQFTHFSHGVINQQSFLGNLRHTLFYLTPPIALAALPGLFQWHGTQRRLILLPALVLVVPILLSPASSPRNLTAGWVLLIVLAADWVSRMICKHGRQWLWIVMAAYLVVSTVYALGTVKETLGSTQLPHSSVATIMRLDGLGWPATAALGLATDTPLFAIDYGVASQLWYYLQRPVYTSWGQYRLWGIPDLNEAQIVSLSFVDPDQISLRLNQVFQTVDGPEQVYLKGDDESKRLWIWHASGRQVEMDTLLDQLDFIDLVQAEN